MRNEQGIEKILVTGGGGYVGALLVPQLLRAGYQVNVLDLFLFGEEVFDGIKSVNGLTLFRGDLRDQDLVAESVIGCDAVIHLACISNDPSFELDPDLGRSINFDAFEPLVRISKDAGVQRFIYASSSSVYGISDTPDVDEEHPLNPITDYSKYKALCEPILFKYQSPDFTTVIVRPATVCGYSPRQRLDLVVNVLTAHAITNGRIMVFGGSQVRPNLHVGDVVDLYQMLLEQPSVKIAGETYNVGFENHTVADLALLVRRVVQEELPSREVIEIVTTPSDDDRSYQITSNKVRDQLGFESRWTIEDAVRELVRAFESGKLPDALENPQFNNLKTLQASDLS